MPAIIRIDAQAGLHPWPDLPVSAIASGSRACTGHRFFHDADNGVTVDIRQTEASLGRWIEAPAHELLIVLSGSAVLVEPDRETVVSQGQALVIPKGRRVLWNQTGPLKVISMTISHPDATALQHAPVIVIDTTMTLDPCDPTPAAVLKTATPTQSMGEIFADFRSFAFVGLWQSTPYERQVVVSPRHELMHILEGSVTMSDATGAAHVFGAGETFLVTLGNGNAWASTESVRKIFCTVTPEAL